MSNSDDDIMRMFENEFDALRDTTLDLYPPAHRDEIERRNAHIYG